MTDSWSEDDSELYRRLAPVAVPDRAEQIATLLTLVPYATDAVFRIVELASGEGLLAIAPPPPASTLPPRSGCRWSMAPASSSARLRCITCRTPANVRCTMRFACA